MEKEPMCFSFLSLSGSEIVERLFNKIPQMSVPRNPLPKYVAKTALRLISIGRDWQPSARLPPTRFFAPGRTANPSSRRREAITRVNVQRDVPGWKEADDATITADRRADITAAFKPQRPLAFLQLPGRRLEQLNEIAGRVYQQDLDPPGPVTKVMRIRGRPAAYKARLPGHELPVLLIAQANCFVQGANCAIRQPRALGHRVSEEFTVPVCRIHQP
jgi:hypothetical protein